MIGAGWLLLCLWLPVRGALAEASPSAGVHWLTTADGLPNLRVEALARDRHGYVWIGTQGGLVRHEGVEISVLRRDPDQPDSLPGNNVLSLMASDDGSIWAAVSGLGVVRIEGTRVTRHWLPESHGGPLRGRYIWSMVESCDGAVWGTYANDGLVRFDPDGAAPAHFSPSAAGLPASGFGVQLLVDESCRLWLLRTDGLWRIDPRPPFPITPVLEARRTEVPAFLSMAVVGDDEAFVGGQRGLLRVGLDGGDADVRQFWRIEKPVGVIRRAGRERLWLGSRRGLILFDPVSGRREAFPSGGRDALAEALISDILPGAEGEVWIAASGAGVARLPPGWRGFRPFPLADGERRPAQVTAAAVHSDAVWVGTADSRLMRVDPASGETRAYPSVPGARDGQVIDLHAGSARVWLLRRTALSRRDIDTGDETTLIRLPLDASPQLEFLESAGQGRFWLADESGRLRLIDAGGETLDAWYDGAGGARQLAEEALVNVLRGPAGRWWLVGGRALYRQDAAGRFVPVHRSPNGEITALAFDRDTLWLASESVLERFRTKPDGLERVDRFTAGDGLPPGRMQALVPGADHLWGVTSIGLMRLALDSRRFRLYSAGEGLGYQFNPNTLVRMSDGSFAAGSQFGLLLIDPEAISPAPGPPPVHVTAIRAGDRLIPLRPGQAGGPRLDWRRNSLEFRFRALSYIDPAQNRFRVRLAGWEDEWQDFIGQTSRFYSRLPSGRYRFEVQAANADGIWNRRGAAVEFEIEAPPWRSPAAWTAYALFALASTGLGWRSLRARRRRVEAMKQMQAHEQMAERQRALLARLNRSIEPERLADRIVEAACELGGTPRGHVALVHPALPVLVRSTASRAEPADAAAIETARRRGGPGSVIELGDPDQPLALVWLPDLHETARRSVQARLELFAQAAGQVLDNARLFAEVRELAKEARRASDAKSEFLATMSHEIRTPLHGLLGMMALLDRADLDGENVETIRTMRAASRQLERILDDVLDLSRIEAGRVDLELRAFELPSMLERVADLHASNAAAAGLRFRLRMASDLPVTATGDADRIAQIVGNLVSNAIKFTDAGSVTLAAWMDRSSLLCLAVSDTGPGIDPAVQRQLFEPFTQLGDSRTRRHSGTGLGLAICRRLVEAMDGRLELESRPGHGSRFTARLPLPGLVRQAPIRSNLLEGLRLVTALGAEDERAVRRLARRWSIESARLARAPRRFDALLYRDGCIGEDRLERLRVAGVTCWHLGEPAVGADDPTARIREPLTEARLVGALLDLRIRRPGDR